MYFALYLKIKNADFMGGLWWTVTYGTLKAALIVKSGPIASEKEMGTSGCTEKCPHQITFALMGATIAQIRVHEWIQLFVCFSSAKAPEFTNMNTMDDSAIIQGRIDCLRSLVCICTHLQAMQYDHTCAKCHVQVLTSYSNFQVLK